VALLEETPFMMCHDSDTKLLCGFENNENAPKRQNPADLKICRVFREF